MTKQLSDENVYRYKRLQTAASKFGQPYARLSSEQKHQTGQLVAKQLELESLILASNEASNVVVPRGQTDAAIAEIVARYPSKHEFNQELEENNLDMMSLRKAVHQELKVEAVFDLVGSQIAEMSETDARLYYYFHPDKFQRVESRSARHILLTINPDFPENTREQALSRISQIARRVRKNPSCFAEQARQYSECPTSMDGGLLGRVAPAKLFPELDQVLFSLQEGEISDVVESQLGFHVLLCEAIHAAESVPVDDILSNIIEQVTANKRKRHQQRWLRGLLNTRQHNARKARSGRHQFQTSAILAKA